MIDVLAVSRPEDAVTDFLSVLDPAHGREVHLVAAERGTYLKLPAGIPLAGRLAAIAALRASTGEGDRPFSAETAAAAITLETGRTPFTVWTHHPSDARGRWGERLISVLPAPVRHPEGPPGDLVLKPVRPTASPYEQERLDATVAWVRRHLDPAAGRVIEIGAHQGGLTRRLLADGYGVDATEPDPVALDRLRTNVAGDVRIHPHSFDDLATTARLTGSAYLLIELLYFGQDLMLLERFPTDRIFVALEPGELARLSWPAAWSVEDEVELIAPRLEPLAGGPAFLRKRGSTGVLLRRVS